MYLLKRILGPLTQNILFVRRGFRDPAPNWVKWRILKEHFFEEGTCVETGTYLGDTTQLLSQHFPMVVSFEPFLPLFDKARERFKNTSNVRLINQSSEEGFEKIVSEIVGPANFWLDGHFSGKGTFAGMKVTPIELELQIISKHLKNMGDVSIAIDDFRLFRLDGMEGYPSPDVLVKFANENGFDWTVERDIFLMRRKPGLLSD